MKKRVPRLVVMMCCFCLTIVFTACTPKEAVSAQLSYAELIAAFQSASNTGLEGIINSANDTDWILVDGRVWTAGSYIEDLNQPVSRQGEVTFAGCTLDGGDAVILPTQVLSDMEDVAALVEDGQKYYKTASAIAADASGNMYVLRHDYITQSTEWETYATRDVYTLCGIDETGMLTQGVRLQFPDGLQIMTAQNGFFDTEGHFWVSAYGDISQPPHFCGLYCFSVQNGELVKSISLPENQWISVGCVFMQKDGSFLVKSCEYINGEFFEFFYLIKDPLSDRPTVEPVTEPNQLKGQGWRFIYSDRQAANGIYTIGTSGIFRWNLEENTAVPLFLWEDYGLNAKEVRTAFITNEEHAVLVTQKEMDEGAKTPDPYQFVNLTPIDGDILAGREVVTIGMLNDGTDVVKNAVEAYNYTEPEVYIKLLDYSDTAADQKNFASGYDMLINDIRNRVGPDILLLSAGMDTANYTRKGMFIDLYTYIDADPELLREDLIPGILAACEYNGQLPTVTVSYLIQTAVGDSDVVDPTPGWTWGEYDALAAQYPDAVPFYNFSRQDILLYLLQMGGEKFIDHANSTAHLDSLEFVRLLQTTAGYPAQPGDQLVDPKPAFTDREALLQISYVSSFRDILLQEYAFDGPVTYKGFPSDSGSGSAAIPDLRVAISSTCADPDAAWTFVRTLLLPAFQDKMAERNSFPLRVDSLQTMAAAALQPTETDYSTPAYLGADLTEEQLDYFKQGLTQAQADQVTALVQSVTTLYQYDAVVADILFEEADAFYNGARTAEEAVAILQNRVQTYLDEQG